MKDSVPSAAYDNHMSNTLGTLKTEFVNSDSRSSPHCAHTSLTSRERADLVNYLHLHLGGALDLLANVQQAQWRLRSVTFTAIQSMFGAIGERANDYSEQLRFCIEDFGGALPQPKSSIGDTTPALENGPSFAVCISNIVTDVGFLSTLTQYLCPIVDRVLRDGDYATSSSITQLLTKSRRLTQLISENIPFPDKAP